MNHYKRSKWVQRSLWAGLCLCIIASLPNIYLGSVPGITATLGSAAIVWMVIKMEP